MTQKTGHTRQQGFTLLELMVTIAVVAILAGAVLLRPPNSDSQTLATTAAQLQVLLLAVSADAIRRNENMGLAFELNSVQLLSYSPGSGWKSVNKDTRPFEIPEEVQLTKNSVGSTAARARARYKPAHSTRLTPDVVLLASGELVPFELQLSHLAVSDDRYAVRSDGLSIELVSL